MFKFVCFFQLDQSCAENKFKPDGDAFLWETQGLFFKFDLESRDLQLTKYEEEATHFKFSVPVITPQTLSPLVSMTVTFIVNTYTSSTYIHNLEWTSVRLSAYTMHID